MLSIFGIGNLKSQKNPLKGGNRIRKILSQFCLRRSCCVRDKGSFLAKFKVTLCEQIQIFL